MKRDLTICDRCGTNDFSGRASVIEFSKLELGGGNARTLDLCEDCVSDFLQWLEKEKHNAKEAEPH